MLKLQVFDNGGKTLDRYTIAFPPYNANGVSWTPYIGANTPSSFWMHGELPTMIFNKWMKTTKDKRIKITDLPLETIQKLLEELEDDD